MIKDNVNSILLDYASAQGVLSVDSIMKLAALPDKSYFRAFSQFLENNCGDGVEVSKGLLNIKSHGIGVLIPQKIIESGLTMFPKGYLKENNVPKHDDLSSFNVIIPKTRSYVETFPSMTCSNLFIYLKEKNAKIIESSFDMKKEIQEIHPVIDFAGLLLRRMTRENAVQAIDNKRTPLIKDLVDAAYHSPSVLIEAFKSDKNFVIAIPFSPGNHADKDHERNFCYFNNEAVFVNELLKMNKKIALLDLTANFASGLVNLCIGKKDIIIIGIHANPNLDPTTYRENIESKQNSFQFNLEPGSNGEEYINVLQEAIDLIPQGIDVVLVIGSVNNYLFDSEGLLCVEAQYQRQIGNIIGSVVKGKGIKKLIIEPSAGFENDSHILFTDLCKGIDEEFNGGK